MLFKKENNYPVLVTRSLVAFPNLTFVIEIARDFSICAIEEASKKNNYILVLTQKKSNIDKPTKDEIYDIGTLCKIIEFSEQKKFYRVKFEAINRMKITNVDFVNNIYVANAEKLNDIIGDENEGIALMRNIIDEFSKPELKEMFFNSFQITKKVSEITDVTYFSNFLASNIPMSINNRQDLLATNNVNERLIKILKILKGEKEIIELDKKIQNSIKNSMDKSQKDYILREKIRQIHKELGDDEKEKETIIERLKNNPYPENIKKKIMSEYKRFESMPPSSTESSISKQYIDYLLDLPWYQKTKDNDDLLNAKKILNDDHYGLEKIKERIIEYLAVKKVVNNLKAPILCFYGPPGTGKTSVAKSIAKALDRKFFKISLGGVSDEAEIRGHRKTYVAAMPGKIIAGLKRCGVCNPVILLDEIDKISKISSAFKGDPTSALLEVLDPEQNVEFNDNYIEEPFDLSNVLFIATANDINEIPLPLLDRMELIEFNSYIEQEKVFIAKDFLIKKQLKINGVDENAITFTNKAIKYIINHYTLEAGVRGLERAIGRIIRKVLVNVLNKNKKINSFNENIDVNDVKKYLGIEMYDFDHKENKDQVGVVTGLAYTSYGGTTMPIEVNYFPGKGNLILTGKLGQVMKESASIALDYVKSNTKKYNINYNLFQKNDIHIHFPEGAIPKDGPSAGIAIALAIISRFSNVPVRSDVAMTGEINLRGLALPIGGLREKASAALRNGITNIIVPNENQRAVSELPKELQKGLKIDYMKSIDDIINLVFKKKDITINAN